MTAAPALARLVSPAIAEPDGAVVARVRRALAEGRFALAFQPVRPAAHPDMLSFEEGLARVLGPDGRPTPAASFIPAMERAGEAWRIDLAALDAAMTALARDRGRRIAVNLSAASLGRADWLDALQGWARRDVDAVRRLIVELTETAAPDPGAAVDTRLRIARAGAAFAVDDFGAGHACLARLPELRPDILKIDRGLVRGAAGDPDRRALLRAARDIGRHFEALTVAEGVEDARMLAAVAELGIDAVQGYFLGAPALPGADGEGAADGAVSGPWPACPASPASRRAAP